jgi:hypothetical protein
MDDNVLTAFVLIMLTGGLFWVVWLKLLELIFGKNKSE